MATISRVTTWSSGDTLTAAALNGEFNNILNDYNGGITNANISGSAAISVSKIATGLSGSLVGTSDTQTLTNKTLTAPTITSPVITLGSDANGDLYTRIAGAFSRLAVGTNGKVLRAVAGLIAYADALKIGTSTRDIATTGAQAITGIGFAPRGVIVFGSFTSAASSAFSVGFYDGTTIKSMSQDDAGKMWFSGELAVVWTSAPTTNALVATASLDSDGFTLNWTKNNSPTGTFNFGYICW